MRDVFGDVSFISSRMRRAHRMNEVVAAMDEVFVRVVGRADRNLCIKSQRNCRIKNVSQVVNTQQGRNSVLKAVAASESSRKTELVESSSMTGGKFRTSVRDRENYEQKTSTPTQKFAPAEAFRIRSTSTEKNFDVVVAGPVDGFSR